MLANLDAAAGIQATTYDALFPGVLGWKADREFVFTVERASVASAYGASSKSTVVEYPKSSEVRIGQDSYVDMTAGKTLLWNIPKASSWDTCFMHAGVGSIPAETELGQMKLAERVSRLLPPTAGDALTIDDVRAELKKVNDSRHASWSQHSHTTLVIFTNKSLIGFSEIRDAIFKQEAKATTRSASATESTQPWPRGVLIVCAENWTKAVPVPFHHRGLWQPIDIGPCKCREGPAHCLRCKCASVGRKCDITNCSCRSRCGNSAVTARC